MINLSDEVFEKYIYDCFLHPSAIGMKTIHDSVIINIKRYSKFKSSL